MRNLISGTVLALLCAVNSGAAENTDAKKLRAEIAGDTKGTAAANPQCQLFTQAEITAYVGFPVRAGENNLGGLGCLWPYKVSEAFATVSVVPSNYFPEMSGGKGFRRLPDLGKRAWVANESGFTAGAIDGDKGVVVVVYGAKATEASAVALLTETLKRRKK